MAWGSRLKAKLRKALVKVKGQRAEVRGIGNR
jgi:hypothetical protein